MNNTLFSLALISVAILTNQTALADVTDFESVVSNMEAPMKGLVIEALFAFWGITATVLLGNVCWQGYQKRIPIEDIVAKCLWIFFIGFVPALSYFLVLIRYKKNL